MRVRIVVPSGVEGPGGLACNQRRAVAALFATRPRLVSRCRVHDGVASETRLSAAAYHALLGKGLVVPNPYATPCRFRRAAHDSGPRQASSIRQIVVRSTEGGTAASVAAFFATTARASTQLIIDDEECWRTLPDLVIPWGAPGVNATGLHIEHRGFAHWSREEWFEHDEELRRSAWKAATWCLQYEIQRRWLTVEQVRRRANGFCRHMDATVAFENPGGHTDPGRDFPRDRYMRWVKAYYAEMEGERTL